MVRIGISSRNAVIATLALVLSPLFLPLALSFMTDIGGLFCIVLCLYACLRAVQARTDRALLAWLAFASLSNAVGGTVRQIAWLGVLVMFPCAVWLMRRRPHVVLAGTLLYLASVALIFTSLRWFLHQPHSESEPLLVAVSGPGQLLHLAVQLLSLLLCIALFLIPVLIAFVTAISFRNRRTLAILLLGGFLCLAAIVPIFLYHPLTLNALLAPFKGNYVSPFGIARTMPIKGFDPIVFSLGPRLVITFFVLVSILSFLAFLISSSRILPLARTQPPNPPTLSQATPPAISWYSLLVLLCPFVIAYLLLLMPRGLRGDLFDRYALPLLLMGLIFLLRLYQDRVRPCLPPASSALVLLFALFAVAGTHDAFSTYRARQAAVSELLAAGIPDNSIDAGFEHNAIAQIERVGYISGSHIRPPAADNAARSSGFPDDCQPDNFWLTPVIVPGYALSFNPAACGGLSRFPPISYRDWLARGKGAIYIVNTRKHASTQP
jgi:hypothetical protein